jgi:hypothetical protein
MAGVTSEALGSAALISVLIVALAALTLLAILPGLLCLLAGLLVWVLALLATAAAWITLLVLLSALVRILFVCHVASLVNVNDWQRKFSADVPAFIRIIVVATRLCSLWYFPEKLGVEF